MDIFTLVGQMSIKGLDKSSKQLSDLEKKTQKVQKGLKVMGAAFTAVGAAGLAMIQSTKKMNAQLGVTALNLGISTKEMRKLALEATNVTFPLDEVVDTFDLLARAGVKDQKVLKETATAFDTLGDATGYSASQVTKMMIPAMKTFGLTAEQMAKKTDVMTYMQTQSTMSMEDFNTMVGYTTPQLVEQGLTIEDLTAGLIYMERQGYAPGRVMTREFMKATTLAEKEQISLNEALGMTTEETEALKNELEGATGMTQEYADVANEQYTIMDKLKQKFSEVTLGMSGFLEPLEPVLAGMTALGPMMLIVSMNTKLATLATHAFGWAWKIALGPIGWAIAAIGLLTIAGIAIWKNWETVGPFFMKMFSNIKIAVLTSVEKILDVLSKFYGWIPILGDKIQEAHDAISGMIDEEKVKKAARGIEAALARTSQYIVDGLGDVEVALKDVAEASELTTDEMIDNLRDLTGKMKDYAREETRDRIDAIDERMDRERDAHRERMDLLQDEYDETIKTIDAELNYALKGYQDELGSLDRQIDAIDDAERGRRRAERKAEFEASISEERDAESRIDLEKRLNELILESGNEVWQAERRLALETQIAEARDAEERANLEKQLADQLIDLEAEKREEIATSQSEAAEERKRLENELAAYLTELQAGQTRTELELRREALEEQMDMAREGAQNAKDQAQEVYDKERDLREGEHEALITNLEDKKTALDTALTEQLKRYDDDEKAFKKMLGEDIKEMEDFVEEYNRLVDELKKIPPPSAVPPPGAPFRVGTIVHRELAVPKAQLEREARERGITGLPERIGMARGGVIDEPTLLMSLRTLRPYAVAGEKGREYVTPGLPSIIINIAEMNVREPEDIDRVGEAIVDRIYLRQGVRI